MLTLSSLVKLRADVRYRLIGDEAVAVQQSNAEIIVLNDVGARVLGLIDGKTTIRDLVAVMAAEYEADPQQLATDILTYLNELMDASIVEETAAPAGDCG